MNDSAEGIAQRVIELERADAEWKILEAAAVYLETYHTNDLYHRVLKLGAKLVRKFRDELRAV